MKKPLQMDPNEREALARRFSSEEMERIEPFFSPFCRTAQIYLANLFLKARTKKISLDEILSACHKQWEGTWQRGTSGRIGDPDDVAPGVGLSNTGAFFAVYRELKIPYPRTLGS